MCKTGIEGHRLYCYIAFVAVCLGICIFNYYYNTKRFAESQQKIVSTFERSMKMYNQCVPRNAAKQIENLAIANQKHQEEIKALLELEFNKIQNEYETQEVWTGILTIVFLIFSFYSLFKSEEMERQGKAALKSIRESEQGAKSATEGIEKDKNTKLDAVQSDYTKWKTDKESDLTRILDEKKGELMTSVKADNKKMLKELGDSYINKASEFTSNLTSKTEQAINAMTERYEELTKSFIKGVEEKNAGEIQRQVDLWADKLNDIKKEYDQLINKIIDEQNPFKGDTDVDKKSDDGHASVIPEIKAPNEDAKNLEEYGEDDDDSK